MSENDEIKWTWEKYNKFCKIMGSYVQTPNGLTYALESLFAIEFPEEKKLELTVNSLGQLWDIKGGIFRVSRISYLCYMLRSIISDEVLDNDFIPDDAKFLANNLQEYLESGGKIY